MAEEVAKNVRPSSRGTRTRAGGAGRESGWTRRKGRVLVPRRTEKLGENGRNQNGVKDDEGDDAVVEVATPRCKFMPRQEKARW